MVEMRRAVLSLVATTVVALVTSSSPGAAQPLRPGAIQNLVANGDFETPDAGAGYIRYSVGSSIDGWGVGAGTVDLVGTFWQAATGDQSLDVNGAGAGGIFQDFSTNAGSKYGIGFALSGNPGCTQGVKRLAAIWNGQSKFFTFNTTGHSYSSMGWVPRGFTATASSSTTEIKFVSFSPGPCGPAIDDVIIDVVH
jgi:choice-of-anchor C domain-containing protein